MKQKTPNNISELICIHQPDAKKILFYTHIPRAFRNTLIGYLYEIAQTYPIILLSENLDLATQRTLQDKTLFPKLKKIIPVNGGEDVKNKPFTKNRYLCHLAKDTIAELNPDILIISALPTKFELYLMRFAEKKATFTIFLQPSMIIPKNLHSLWNNLENAERRFPLWMPRKMRLSLAKIRNCLKNYFYFWLLPLSVAQKPLWKELNIKSHIHKQAIWTAWTQQDYNILLAEGVLENNLYIIPHPLTKKKPNNFLNKKHLNQSAKHSNNKIITLLLPDNYRFKKQSLSAITLIESIKHWSQIIQIINTTLKEWSIYTKPHPNIKYFHIIKKQLESKFDNIQIADPEESIDKYIEIADIIIALPTPTSTALVTASLQFPDKMVISLDNHQDLCGDLLKKYPGIIYIDNLQKLKNILENYVKLV